jgi:hypothetical protein
VHPVRGTSEVQLLRERVEVPQMSQLHGDCRDYAT